jgi:hypothetical protein
MRANPKTFCTKWLEQSNAMTDEEHAEADAKMRDARQLAWLMNADPAYAKRQALKRDRAPLARALNDSQPFSLFADTSHDPK